MALWVSGQGIPGFWSHLLRYLMSFGVYTDSGKLRMNSRKKRVEEVRKNVYYQIAFEVI